MRKYESDHSLVSATPRDDTYNTRQHAFNIGLAYTSVCSIVALCAVIGFKIEAVWLLRGILFSMVIGVFAFAKALIDFTKEARDIQWETSMPQREELPVVKSVASTDSYERASFPSPRHRNGLLFTSVALSDKQRDDIASSALQHGKLTVNYLTSLGLTREDAERLREELAAHSLVSFNERNEAVLTDEGRKSFEALLK